MKDLPQKISLVSSQEVCEPYLHIPEDNPEGENQVHVLYVGIHVSLTFEVFKCRNGKDGLEWTLIFLLLSVYHNSTKVASACINFF